MAVQVRRFTLGIILLFFRYHPGRVGLRDGRWSCCGRLVDHVSPLMTRGCTRIDHTDDWFEHSGVREYRVPGLLFSLLCPLPEAWYIADVPVTDGEDDGDPIAMLRRSRRHFSHLSELDFASDADRALPSWVPEERGLSAYARKHAEAALRSAHLESSATPIKNGGQKRIPVYVIRESDPFCG